MTEINRPEPMQNGLVDLIIDARDWAEQRTEIMDRESVSSSWADDIQWSDDEGTFIANQLADFAAHIDGLIKYGLDVIARAQDGDAYQANDRIMETAEHLLNGLLFTVDTKDLRL